MLSFNSSLSKISIAVMSIGGSRYFINLSLLFSSIICSNPFSNNIAIIFFCSIISFGITWLLVINKFISLPFWNLRKKPVALQLFFFSEDDTIILQIDFEISFKTFKGTFLACLVSFSFSSW